MSDSSAINRFRELKSKTEDEELQQKSHADKYVSVSVDVWREILEALRKRKEGGVENETFAG